MGLAPGSRLGPYEITGPLGVGGMGEVYRARDTRLERIVAIKILPAQLSADPVRKQRFEREAKTISSLNHPHICVLHDIGSQDGVDYLVMECVEGETLAKRLEKGPLPLEQILRYGAQIAVALDQAHRSAVVHRDLKPGNIMLTAAGAKLLDFGLAKPAGALVSGMTLTAATTQTTPVTAEGTIVGTVQYMSPEQIEGKEVDGRSDIFSLGAVLYEMLTGQKAFQGKSQLSVASAILEKEPAAISSVKPMTPPALDHAIRRCLAKDVEQRWQAARDLALELSWIGEGSQAGASAMADGRLRARRERFAWVAAVILLFALGAVGIVSLRNAAPPAMVVRSAIVPPADNQFYATDINGGGPALSPDGRELVSAILDSKGKVSLWLRDLNDPAEGRMLPGTEGGGHPFWSPDGHSIGFFAVGKLKRIGADGNSLQTLRDSSRGRGGAWSPNGTILFTPSSNSGLYEISANGGTPKQVTELNRSHAENSHRWPTFLTDGRHFLFFVRNYKPELSGIYVGALGSKEYRLLVQTPFGAAFVPERTILFVRNETLFAQAFDLKELTTVGEPIPLPEHVEVNSGTSAALFTVSDNGMMAYYPVGRGGGPYQIAWYGRDGKSSAPLATGYFYGPALSPDGSHALVPTLAADGLSSDVWSYDLVRGTKTRISSGAGYKNSVAWQPDGQTVYFSSALGDVSHIYRVKSDGTGTPETVLQSEDVAEHPESACRDGRYLAYNRGLGTAKASIWILPVTGGQKPFPLVQSQFSAAESAFSPDCKWVAYHSNESGQLEIFVTRFPDASRKYLVSTEGGTNPHWRGDGKELFYFSLQRKSLIAVGVEEKGQELALSAPHALFAVPSGPVLGSLYDVTQDGQRFLVFGPNSSSAGMPLTLVMNWDAELKKK
jgi:Tol biopolymer transport system component